MTTRNITTRPDLPPDVSAAQIQHQLRLMGFATATAESPQADDPITRTEQIGQRNLEWLKFINQHLPAGKQLSFSSPATQNGYPIDKPTEYSPGIIAQKLQQLETDLPEAMKAVIFNNSAYTPKPPLATAEYLKWGLKIDGLYQTALRWVMMQPYLDELAQARAEDIRGYYYFNKMTDAERAAALAHPAQWTSTDSYRDWMISLCLNNDQDLNACKARLQQGVSQDENLTALYQKWEPAGAETYQSFFKIPAAVARHDLTFTDPNALHVPFLDPQNADILAFLRDNIQAEWQFSAWHLLLDFGPTAAAHVRFVSGATPHVNALGGNEITMNSDEPLTEYDTRWTIRHEFGHVLGFPDCYVEYYDQDRQVIVSYQLDINNLMCSRRGHIEQKHVDELRRMYGPSAGE